MARRVAGVVLTGSLVIAGCAPRGTTPPATEPPAASPLVTISSAELAAAIRFRTSFGLRADEAWIRAVAADPASGRGVAAYGVPLTPHERAELDLRQRNAEAIVEGIRAYGLGHPAQWAGVFIDPEASGVVVAQFARALEDHEQAIRRILHPDARFEVRLARWSLLELEALTQQVKAGEAFLSSVDASLSSVSVHESSNRVRLRSAPGGP